MARPPRSPSRSWAGVVVLGASVWLLGACFDSDELYQPAAVSTSTTGPIPTTSSSSSTSGSSSTTAAPEVTCRDAIDCVVGCAAELQTSKLPEPDLTCFLECEEGLTVPEALHLFRLTECVTNKCIEQDVCDVLVPTETSTGTSSSGGDSSSSGTSTGGVPANPCLDCILANMLDPNPGGVCQELADLCI